VLIFIFLGFVSFAAVNQRDQNQPDRRECRAFTIGVSAIGGPDCLR
jgi:hypothetical protein